MLFLFELRNECGVGYIIYNNKNFCFVIVVFLYFDLIVWKGIDVLLNGWVYCSGDIDLVNGGF